VLAKQYENEDHNIIFATQDLPYNINDKIKDSGYQVKTLLTNDVDEIINIIKLEKVDMVVIDHYDIDINYETKLKDKTGVKILSFDDMYSYHNCDIVLNHNVCGKKERYKDLVPKNCEIRCGEEFTLIRDEFKIEKNKPKQKKDKLSVLVAIGGSDSTNINIKILEVLETFQDIYVDVVTTNANGNLEELKFYCKDKKSIKLHIDTTKMAKLIHNSNFAIITPSVTANEVLFMGVPFIAIKTVDNQDEMYRYLIKNNYEAMSKFKGSILMNKIQKILNEKN